MLPDKFCTIPTMKLADEHLYKALQTFMGHGPGPCDLVHKRWAVAYPDATAEDFQEWEVACREIVEYLYVAANLLLDHKITAGEAIRRIVERYPHLDNDRMGGLFYQAVYGSR